MAHTYTLISTASFIMAGVFLIISSFLWFKFNIPKIVGDLSGRTAKKSIEKMRQDNEKTGKRQINVVYMADNKQNITEKIEKMTAKSESNNTDVLFQGEATELLQEGRNGEEVTEYLENVTEPLIDTINQVEGLEIMDSIVLIHSNEII